MLPDTGRDPRAKGEGDPLAELARLIGQTDPFAARQPQAAAPRHEEPAYRDESEYEEPLAPPAPPSWMQRAHVQPPQPQHYGDEPASQPAAEPDYRQAPDFAADQNYPSRDQFARDPERYDDALYGHTEGAPDYPQDDAYAHEQYGYQDAYAEPEEAPKRRGGMATVAIVLALAVVGTGGAFAYRSFFGSHRSGEPPVIKADPGPNKIVPPSATASSDPGKAIQDRLGGNAPERMVSREEQPVNVQDATKAGGPRVVFPPLNQNANPPAAASVAPSGKPLVGNGAMQGGGDEPRRVRTVPVRGDQADSSNATPASRQAPARITAPATQPANAPMSLAPQSTATATAPARVAAINPAQQAATAAGGGYVVQISSQRSENDAQASFKALQTKFPSVLGSRTALIKRADLGEKGTYYRAMVGPFGTPDEASQFCGNLKSAGGQCVVQRN
ncbi:MAG: SPOR domain-containing protein [Tardiphaga sp.]